MVVAGFLRFRPSHGDLRFEKAQPFPEGNRDQNKYNSWSMLIMIFGDEADIDNVGWLAVCLVVSG